MEFHSAEAVGIKSSLLPVIRHTAANTDSTMTGGKKISCPLCENRIRNLKRHLLDVHAAGKKYAAKICGEIVDSRKGKRAIKCPCCHRKFIDLPVHMLRSHGELTKKARSSLVKQAKRDLRRRCSKPDELSSSSGEEKSYHPPGPAPGRDRSVGEKKYVISSSDDREKAVGISSHSDSEKDLWSEFSTATDGAESLEDASPEISETIDRYESWLQTWVGGDVKKELALEMAAKIRRISDHGLPTLEDITDGTRVASCFEELPKQKGWAPGTTVAYICAYKNFLEYLFIAKKITAEIRDAVTAVVSRIGTAVYRQRKLRDSERLCDEEDMIIDGKQFQVSIL